MLVAGRCSQSIVLTKMVKKDGGKDSKFLKSFLSSLEYMVMAEVVCGGVFICQPQAALLENKSILLSFYPQNIVGAISTLNFCLQT